MATDEALMTAEEFARRPDPGHPEELILGRIIVGRYPEPLHGLVCSNTLACLDEHVRRRDLGRVITLHGVITTRDPDSVRSVDASFYGYDRLPRGPLRDGYGPEVPEVAIEVVSLFDRWAFLIGKAGQLLGAGTKAVVLLDPATRTAHVFAADEAPRLLEGDEELTLPGVLGGFAVPVSRFFA